MNKGKKERIFDELVALQVVLGIEQKKERLVLYANQLESYDLNDVIGCLRRFHGKALYFPRLPEIIEDLAGLKIPTDDMATAIASEIIECISMFGSHQAKEVKAYLGDKYGIVERFGRWSSLSMISDKEVPATRAQLRELAKVYINKSKREVLENGGEFEINTNPILIGRDGKKIGDVKMKDGLIDYDYYLEQQTPEDDVKLPF